MIQKEFRLKRKKDIEILMKEGSFCGGAFVTAKVWKIDPDAYPRRELTTSHLLVGFSVGKKLSKSAVKRNYQRRRMREAVRALMKQSPWKKGYLVLFIAKPSIVDASFVELQKDIASISMRTKIQ